MADDSEEKPSTSHDFASTKAAIFDTFNKLKKWREEQLEDFRNRQYLESQRLLRLSGESQKQFEKLIENASKSPVPEDKPKEIVPEISDVSSISLANDLDNYDTFQESSITGHLQRCFNDSSRSNVSVSENKVPSVPEKIPVFSEFRNLQFSEKNLGEKEDQLGKDGLTNGPVKPKRPFLKKGSGLLKYRPKSATNRQITRSKGFSKADNPSVKSPRLPQKTLKLKPAIRKTDAPSEHVKHIRFDITDFNNDVDVEELAKNDLPSVSKISGNTEVNFDEKNKSSPSSSSCLEICSPESNKLYVSNSGSESLSLSKENKELEEFEMLENCAQNSSFNSDSSVVQRILRGESTESSSASQNYIAKLLSENNVAPAFKEMCKNPPESSNFSEKIGLSQCLEEVQARKQMLHKVISDINPRIQSLEKEISSSKKEALDDSDMSERCSTPIEDLNLEDRNLSSALPECDSNIGSLDLENSPTVLPDTFVDDIDEAICESNCRCCDVDDDLKNLYPNQDNVQNICNEEEESVYDVCNEADENEQVSIGKSKIREKLLELEKEIETYQQLNARASSICNERDEIVRKLQKERDDFNKYKEAEKTKVEAEIQEERRQIKRQKETFMRYQKLRKDNPTKKEREELSALRQEIEKLQEELKRQKIKYTNDSRRWKNRLDAAERERDSFKLENIKLEEQCQDLLAALKTRMKKKPEIKSFDNEEEDNAHETVKHIPMNKDAASQTQAKDLDSDVFRDSNPKPIDAKRTKSKVHFNLSSEQEKNELEIINEDIGFHPKNPSKDDNFLPKEGNVITDNNRHGNVEKDAAVVNLSIISVSAEAEFKEINHGNRVERIYSSGEREIIFNSGTRKVISADGKTKYLFYNGDVKEVFPDRREIYRYVNGVTETQFPDGLKVTEYPNGQTQRRYPDGQKEVRLSDGSVHNIYADGSEELRSADGNVINLGADGTKIIEFANGQKEIRTATYKRREFPDGSIKIVYDSGRQETRYSNGRIRIKDKEGKVLFDTKYLSIPKG